MAIPGYHDPVYDPVMVTGEATPLEDPWQEKVAKALRYIQSRLNKGGFTPGHPANVWKGAMDKMLGGETGLMAPPDQPPTGIGTIVTPDPEAMSRWGRGDSPYTMGEEGLSGRLPTLKPGRAADVLNIASSAPIGAVFNAPGMLGVIRRKGDLITPEVAKGLAERIMGRSSIDVPGPEQGRHFTVSPVGPINVHEDVVRQQMYPATREKFAQYIAKIAGGENDPLQNVKMSGAHPGSLARVLGDEPLFPVEPGTIHPGRMSEDLREGFREDLLVPETSKLGTAIDDLVGGSLEWGRRLQKEVTDAKTIAGTDPAEMERLRQIAEALPGGSQTIRGLRQSLSPEAIQTRLSVARDKFAEHTGIREKSQDESLAALPQGALVGGKVEHAKSEAETQLKKILNSRRFVEYLATINKDDFAKMSFPDIMKGFDKANTEAMALWEKNSRGVPISPALTNPRGEWQDLTAAGGRSVAQQLAYEGQKQGICVGGESYCREVERGVKKIFSLRDKETNRPLITMDMDKQTRLDMPNVTPKSFFDAAFANIQAADDPVGALRQFADDLSWAYEGSDHYTRSILNELNRHVQGELDIADYFRRHDGYTAPILKALFGGRGSSFEANAGNDPERAARFFRSAGFDPPRMVQKWVLQQVKGKGNMVEGIDPALKEEVKAFLAAHPEIDTSSSGDYSSIMGGTGNRFQKYSRESLRQIKDIYDPAKGKVETRFGRPVLRMSNGETYTAEGPDILYQWLNDSVEKPRWSAFEQLEAPGVVKTEIARRLKSAKGQENFVGPAPELSALTREVDPKTGEVNRTKEALRRWILKERRAEGRPGGVIRGYKGGSAVDPDTGDTTNLLFTPDGRHAFVLDRGGDLAAIPVTPEGELQWGMMRGDIYDVVDDDTVLNAAWNYLNRQRPYPQ